MIERPVPQDILKYKQKAIKNFSARECIWGGLAGVVCMAGMFTNTGIEELSNRALVSFIPAIPFCLIGFVKIYGVPFEKIIGPFIFDNFICPVKRKKEYHNKSFEEYEKKRMWFMDETDPKKLKKLMKKKAKPSKQIKVIR